LQSSGEKQGKRCIYFYFILFFVNRSCFFLLKKHVNIQIYSGEDISGKTKTNYTE